MLRTSLLLLSLTFAFALRAQTKEPLRTLTGGKSQKWAVSGTNAAAPKCKSGDATYTFQAKPAGVIKASCVGGKWKKITQKVTKWSALGKSGIAFGGAKYEVTTLPASTPACKGRAHCVCLATVPDGQTTTKRTIYLTH